MSWNARNKESRLRGKVKLNEKICLVPCSGIGKCLGSITREAAYIVNQELLPEDTKIVALSRMMMDEETQKSIAGQPVITLDGCTLACATKTVTEKGGMVVKSIAAMDALRQHRGLKPAGIAEMNEDAITLAHAIAIDIRDFIKTPKGKE
jgi:uncharacterized metal-binding protein